MTRKQAIVFVFVVSALLTVSTSYAALVPGSEGSVTLIGNDGANSTGSFKCNVAYQVYDGTSASDPLGANNVLQLAFVLDHLGDNGELPALNIGRFSVFAPSPASTTSAFYSFMTSINPATAGQYLVGPSGNQLDPFGGAAATTNIDPPPTGANRGRFLFQSGLQEPTFAPGQHSQLLVLTPADDGGFPADIVIELNGTLTVPQIHADTIIRVIPEPASALFLGLAATFYRRTGRR